MAKFVAYDEFDAATFSQTFITLFTDFGSGNSLQLDSDFPGLDFEVYDDYYILAATTPTDTYEFIVAGDLTLEGPEDIEGTIRYIDLKSQDGGELFYISEIAIDFDLALLQLFDEAEPGLLFVELFEGDDAITLSEENDVFDAFGGDDTIDAGEGFDTVMGNIGNDIIDTGGNNGEGGEGSYDKAYGGEGDDYIYLRGGKELAHGGDLLVADAGIDTASFARVADGGVTVSLSTLQFQEVREGHLVDLVSIENLVGTDDNDVLSGDAGSNLIEGGDGNDTLSAGGGEDSLDGGDGFDTAVFNGDREAFEVTQPGLGLHVTEIAVDFNRTTLAEVEKLQFDDGALVFDIDSENVSFAYRIYAAAYGRTPDEDGLRFWTDVLDDRGDGPPEVDDKEFIASFFLTANEFVDLYGENPTNEEYINALYLNVLKREADSAGYEFWLDQIDGGQGKDDLVIFFTDSDENLDNTAPDLDNGIWVL